MMMKKTLSLINPASPRPIASTNTNTTPLPTTPHDNQIGWKLVETGISFNEEISSVALFGHDLFIGGSRGKLYKFRVRKHVHRNGNCSFTYNLKCEISCGSKGVTQLTVVSDLGEILVLCGGELSIRSLNDLSSRKVVPLKDISSFCCNCDGNPFYGLCASSKTKLVIYNLKQDLSASRTFIVPEQPKVIKWYKRHICLGFRSEYSILTYEGGQSKGLLEVPSIIPIIETLPMDEIALAQKNSICFITPNRTKPRDLLSFTLPPHKIAFSFPFLVSCSYETIEVKNLVDPQYHYNIKKPFDVRALTSDGSEIVVCSTNQVYYMCPSSITYRIYDSEMLVKLRKNPSDKVSFVRYITYLLTRDPKNPFKLLLTQYAEKFVAKFPDPENVDLKLVKQHISIAIKRLSNVVTSFFKQFKSKVWQDLLYTTVQSIFYSKIYFLIFAMITVTNRVSDSDALSKMMTYTDIHPGHLGAQKRFWLTKESLLDPPSQKKRSTTTDESHPPTTTLPASLGEDKSDTIINDNKVSPPDEPASKPPLMEMLSSPTDDEEHLFSLSDSFDDNHDPIRGRNSSKINLHSSPSPSPLRPKFSNARIKNSSSSGPSTSRLLDSKLKFNVSQSLKVLFLGEEKVDLNTQVELFAEVDSTSRQSLGHGTLTIDDQNRLIIKSLNSSDFCVVNPENSLTYDQADLTISWISEKLQAFSIKLASSEVFNDVSRKLKIYLNKKNRLRTDSPIAAAAGSGSIQDDSQSDSIDSISALKQANAATPYESDESGTMASFSPSFNSPSSSPPKSLSSSLAAVVEEAASIHRNQTEPKAAPKEDVKVKPEADLNQNADQLHNNPSTTSPPNQKEDLPPTKAHPPDFNIPSYDKPINTLRAISTFYSPRDKLRCILQTFKDTIKCVTDFWEPLGYDPVVGADDLVPIFAYIILKAQIPKVFSEMNFIWEFASDEETTGKYGYGYATFQIGVEAVARLDDTIYQLIVELESNDQSAPPPPLPVVKDVPSQHLEGILEKRENLVNRRPTYIEPKYDEDVF